MKKWGVPALLYVIVCMGAQFLPASEGYDTILWKLTIGQFYAVPVLLVALLVSFLIGKRSQKGANE